jgi:glycosyltransferase involved in cell wall biosynthesis
VRIAINIARVGGHGGVARNLFTLTRAMGAHDIDIYAMQVIPRGFVPQGENLTLRWFERTTKGIHIALDRDKEYDLFLYYASRAPIYIGEHLNVRTRAIIPNGNDVRAMERHFDYVVCQAADGVRYFEDQTKKATIIPCVIIPVDGTEPIADLPSEYFLTVFNPYDLDRPYDDGLKPSKGHDLLYRLADSLALPLVWCHTSDAQPIDHNIKDHPNIIHFDTLKQEKMYYLYQHATAYVSFSREESFGWAVADAIMFDKPIISRRVGVLSSMASHSAGLYLYEDPRELRQLLQMRAFKNGAYQKDSLSPQTFERKILSLARVCPHEPPS